LLEPSASPIANLIPELSYLAVSLSKCIAPALRVSYLLVPDAASEQSMRNNLQATMQMPPPLMVALATIGFVPESPIRSSRQFAARRRADSIWRSQNPEGIAVRRQTRRTSPLAIVADRMDPF